MENDADDLLSGMSEPIRIAPRASRKAADKPKAVPKKKSKPEKPKSEAASDSSTPTVQTFKSAVVADGRILSKKAVTSLRDAWSDENAAKTRNALMDGFIASAKDRFGVARVFGSREELEQLAIGIPVPSLVYEWVTGNDCFLLDSVSQIAGSWSTCKSSLAYEILRWFYNRNGIAVHIDTENKFDSDFACAIMQSPPGVVPFISNRAKSLEESQDMLTYYMVETKKSLIGTKESPGPGRTVPCVYLIDSIAAAASEELQEKIIKTGHADRAHPVGPLKTKHYLDSIKSLFEGWPMALLLVTHEKSRTSADGTQETYTLGGTAQNFHESIELRNSVWKSSIRCSDFEGIGIKIRCSKNSFGPPRRSALTRFLWKIEIDEQTGEPIERYWWDWDWSICTLLDTVTGVDKEQLKRYDINITTKSPKADVECLANLPALGMGKSEFLPFVEVGKMIHANEEVKDRIRAALRIKRRPILREGYDEIVKKHISKVK